MLVAGQKLWFVGREKHLGAHEIEVVKIGNKWATVSEYGHLSAQKLCIKTLRLCWRDGGTIGQCYTSKAEWETEESRCKAWVAFRSSLERHGFSDPPSGVTEEAIRQAMELVREKS